MSFGSYANEGSKKNGFRCLLYLKNGKFQGKAERLIVNLEKKALYSSVEVVEACSLCTYNSMIS